MTTFKILSSLVFVLVSESLYSQLSEAQTLSIILQTDKKAYYHFEPIVLTTEFKNISKVNQWYWEPQILYTPVQYKIYYKRKEIHPYSQFEEIIGRGGAGEIGEDTAVKPGMSKKSSGVISKYFDLSKCYGTVILEVGYPKVVFIEGKGEKISGHKTESITVKIKNEPAHESIPVQLFSEAVSSLLGRSGHLGKNVKENLEKIVYEYPNSYLIDQVYYFLSYYYYQVYEDERKPEQLEAAKKYLSEFFKRFPQSVYRNEAEGLEKMINKL